MIWISTMSNTYFTVPRHSWKWIKGMLSVKKSNKMRISQKQSRNSKMNHQPSLEKPKINLHNFHRTSHKTNRKNSNHPHSLGKLKMYLHFHRKSRKSFSARSQNCKWKSQKNIRQTFQWQRGWSWSTYQGSHIWIPKTWCWNRTATAKPPSNLINLDAEQEQKGGGPDPDES